MKKIYVLLLFSLALIFSGCSNDDEMSLRLVPEGIDGLAGNTLTVSSTYEDRTFEIPLTGITGEVSVSVSYDPGNEGEDDWLTAKAIETVTRATDSDWKIVVETKAFFEEKTRTGFVAIRSGNEELTLTVTQLGIADKTEMVVVCEGLYTRGTAALSAIKYSGEAVWNVFEDVNKKPLGDVAQSLTYLDGKYFVVLNNSKQIRVIEPQTFKWLGEINYEEGRPASPRFMVRLNDKEALVSDSERQLVKINYKDYSIIEYIDMTSVLPGSRFIEKMTRVGDKIFCNAKGQGQIWMYDANNFEPLNPQKIKIRGVEQTAKMIEDKNGKLWVMGSKYNSSAGRDFPVLFCIDQTGTIVDSFEVPVVLSKDEGYKEGCITGAPGYNRMDTDRTKSRLYFVLHTWEGNNKNTGAIYSFDVDNKKLERYRLLPEMKLMYGMGISPDGEVYLCDCLDYTAQRGYVRHYKADGTVDSKLVGIYPRMIHFTEYDK